MADGSADGARAALDRVAREDRGRLVAALASRTGDIAGAEDALAEAFARAMPAWSAKGIPRSPSSWLLTVARNVQRDRWKSAAYRLETTDDATAVEMEADDMTAHDIPDDRMKLLFVCAHPAIAENVRTALMLQVVLGVEPARMAHAFAISAQALSQRLVRAKRKILEARIPFSVPGADDLEGRLRSVLEAIYGAYALTFQMTSEDMTEDLSVEALWLADVAVNMWPDEPEVLGLAALLNLSSARRTESAGPVFVPLADQDPAAWDAARTARGLTLLRRAGQLRRIGPFQLEAAIQAVHAARVETGRTDWAAIVTLYQGLLRVAPTLGARIAHAAAVAERDGPDAGLGLLDGIDGADGMQAYWATRAHLLSALGRPEARQAYRHAAEKAATAPLKQWLLERASSPLSGQVRST
ncbi:RNA polymerase sigma factor [Jannaschia aquimarina]|uniref:RNA polymerase sigma factor n=1 Tax=Jannaschia aquimarina TaxID=935700 RepID=A0A0D1D763_9RHOB|nr:DUF6596 domain-containing protein [Jannaschia aquimarina]KIT15778.1 RNA polymerase sigma factor [Jannaschia aquimarina]SNT31606.1 RNA polymerase sigma-70 factor, ECF subfamily [Jannaschia aquimarina]